MIKNATFSKKKKNVRNIQFKINMFEDVVQ